MREKLCELSYKDNSEIAREISHLEHTIFENSYTDAKGFAYKKDGASIICFRGTDTRKGLNLGINMNYGKWDIHEGYWNAYNSVRPQIDHYFNERLIFLMGHSMGAGMVIASLMSNRHTDSRIEAVVYSCPPVITENAMNDILLNRNIMLECNFFTEDPVTHMMSDIIPKRLKRIEEVNNEKIRKRAFLGPKHGIKDYSM